MFIVYVLLGRGAYGVVEKMKHKQTGTIVAVKVYFQSLYEKAQTSGIFLTSQQNMIQ